MKSSAPPPSDEDDAWDQGLAGMGDQAQGTTSQARRIRAEVLREWSRELADLDQSHLQALEKRAVGAVLVADTAVAAETSESPVSGSGRVMEAALPSKGGRIFGRSASRAGASRNPWNSRWAFPSGAVFGAAFSLLLSVFWLGSMDRGIPTKSAASPDLGTLHHGVTQTLEVPSPSSAAVELSALLIADSAEFEVLPMQHGFEVRISVKQTLPPSVSKWLNLRGISIQKNGQCRLLLSQSP